MLATAQRWRVQGAQGHRSKQWTAKGGVGGQGLGRSDSPQKQRASGRGVGVWAGEGVWAGLREALRSGWGGGILCGASGVELCQEVLETK